MKMTSNPLHVLTTLIGKETTSQLRNDLREAFYVCYYNKEVADTEKLRVLAIAEGDMEKLVEVHEHLDHLFQINVAVKRWSEQGLQNQLEEIIGLLQ